MPQLTHEPSVLPIVATRMAIPTGAEFAANTPANTTSDDPGNKVAEVKAAMKRVKRMGKCVALDSGNAILVN